MYQIVSPFSQILWNGRKKHGYTVGLIDLKFKIIIFLVIFSASSILYTNCINSWVVCNISWNEQEKVVNFNYDALCFKWKRLICLHCICKKRIIWRKHEINIINLSNQIPYFFLFFFFYHCVILSSMYFVNLSFF